MFGACPPSAGLTPKARRTWDRQIGNRPRSLKFAVAKELSIWRLVRSLDRRPAPLRIGWKYPIRPGSTASCDKPGCRKSLGQEVLLLSAATDAFACRLAL